MLYNCTYRATVSVKGLLLVVVVGVVVGVVGLVVVV